MGATGSVMPSTRSTFDNRGLRVLVQPSDRRIFTDREYERVGAEITEDLSPASVVFGVKQVPVEDLLPDRSYVFSHVIKGTGKHGTVGYCWKKIRLFDYETITTGSRNSPRLVAFGGFAGRAGMVAPCEVWGKNVFGLLNTNLERGAHTCIHRWSI